MLRQVLVEVKQAIIIMIICIVGIIIIIWREKIELTFVMTGDDYFDCLRNDLYR